MDKMAEILNRLDMICENLGIKSEKKKRVTEDEYVDLPDEEKDVIDEEVLLEEDNKE